MHELRAPRAFEELMATKLHELKAQQAFGAGAVRQGFGMGGFMTCCGWAGPGHFAGAWFGGADRGG